jgi:HEAT repeat protein
VVEIHVPSPAISESTRNKIAALIRDLGSSEYAKRKAAAAGLQEFGPLARPQLSEVLQQTSDPEVRRSAQTILEEVNK